MAVMARSVLLGFLAAAPVKAQSSGESVARGVDTLRRRPAARLDSITVVGGRRDDLIGLTSSASQGRVGSADLRSRPIAREGELLEAVPGVIVTQHSGDGKANQYFIRGFNLDHGTDFQTKVDGCRSTWRRTPTAKGTPI